LVGSGLETLAPLSLLAVVLPAAYEAFFVASYGFLGPALEDRGFVAFGIVTVE
jgi:hypothetical protein